jgi:H+/Cl- antiporter ClcA
VTDFQTEQSPKEGQGKAVSGSIVTCVSVMLALILSDLYPDFFKQMKDNGYPLAVIAGVLAGMIAYIIIWWTSKSLVSRIIEFILDLKRIAKVWQSPLPPT